MLNNAYKGLIRIRQTKKTFKSMNKIIVFKFIYWNFLIQLAASCTPPYLDGKVSPHEYNFSHLAFK